jgi:hypothetical protein
MAWTTPRTWVAGETHTAAQHNTHVRDNLNYLYGARLGGWVATGGTVVQGTLYSSVKDSTGQYTITYDTPFAIIPAVVVTPVVGTSLMVCLTSLTTSAFTVTFRNTAAALTDTAFNFIVVESV